jgi:uncharacterized protein
MQEEKKYTQDFWEKFLTELDNNYTFPAVYEYKFIVPSHTTARQELMALFAEPLEDVQTRASSSGKYTSISISKIQNSAEEIIAQYIKTQHIPGLLSL